MSLFSLNQQLKNQCISFGRVGLAKFKQSFYGKTLLNREGFSYVEVLAATILIGTCLVPLLDGLSTTASGPRILEEDVINRLAMQAKMDELLKEPFLNLTTAALAAGGVTVPTTFSDQITSSDNRQIKRDVYISLYDGDNLDGDADPFTGTDPTLIYIKVALDESITPLESLVSQ